MRISAEVANQNVESPGLPGCTLESPRNAGIRAQANEHPVCVGESSCPATTRPAETKNAISAGSASAVHLNSTWRSEEHTSELQSRLHLVCRLLLEKKKKS